MIECLMKLCARLLASLALGVFLSAAGFAADPTIKDDTDLAGADLKWFDLPRPWPELCQEACRNNDDCRAWTYMKQNVRGPLASCWLKKDVGQATPNQCCSSGMR